MEEQKKTRRVGNGHSREGDLGKLALTSDKETVWNQRKNCTHHLFFFRVFISQFTAPFFSIIFPVLIHLESIHVTFCHPLCPLLVRLFISQLSFQHQKVSLSLYFSFPLPSHFFVPFFFFASIFDTFPFTFKATDFHKHVLHGGSILF